ncbi:hypothetical protein ACXZ9C_10720 [Streptococcus agalactiae]
MALVAGDSSASWRSSSFVVVVSSSLVVVSRRWSHSSISRW